MTTPAHSSLALHDALPISAQVAPLPGRIVGVLHGEGRQGVSLAVVISLVERAQLIDQDPHRPAVRDDVMHGEQQRMRSEEHTSELQSPCNLVCRLLLGKNK